MTVATGLSIISILVALGALAASIFSARAANKSAGTAHEALELNKRQAFDALINEAAEYYERQGQLHGFFQVQTGTFAEGNAQDHRAGLGKSKQED